MKSAICFLLAVCLFALPIHAQDTKTIRLDQFVPDNAAGDQSTANLVNAKLISYLAKYHVPVVESGNDADAVLTGSFQVASATTNGNTRYRVQGAVRLTDKDGKVLWGDDVRSNPFAQSATSSFAEQVAKKVADFWKSYQGKRN
jgi:hypothetical protein